MKKRCFTVFIACVLVLGIGASSAKAEAWQNVFRQLPLEQQQAIDQVANKFGGDINGLRALYVVGPQRSHQIVLPAGHNLLWTAWQDGWVSSTYRPKRSLSGKQVIARLNGELIALFYPDGKGFLFAVLDKPIQYREMPMTTKSIPIKIVWSNQAYKFLDEEVYVPPTN